ncbi:MAG: hypothetical protein O8C62_00920 [Candidatus Methanoperedens sp.]|nr:hypothetical protein [Candidatus Methanoperedens sp.]
MKHKKFKNKGKFEFLNCKRHELKDFSAKEKLEIVQSERVASAGGRKGGLGGIPPALQILGEICSNFFERTPPICNSFLPIIFVVMPSMMPSVNTQVILHRKLSNAR